MIVREHQVGSYTMTMFGFGRWKCGCRTGQRGRVGQKIKHKNQTGITHVPYHIYCMIQSNRGLN